MVLALASSSLDSHIRIWDVESGAQLRPIDAGPVDAWTITFSPDSKFIASGSHSGRIHLYGVENGRQEQTLDTRGKFTLSIAYVSLILYFPSLQTNFLQTMICFFFLTTQKKAVIFCTSKNNHL